MNYIAWLKNCVGLENIRYILAEPQEFLMAGLPALHTYRTSLYRIL